MDIVVTGRHVEVTEAMMTHVEQKLDRIIRHFSKMLDLHIVLSVESKQQKAEALINIRGKRIHCEAISQNLYHAIDMLSLKVDRQIMKHKDRGLRQHHRDKLVNHLMVA